MQDYSRPSVNDQLEADIKLIDSSMKLAAFGASRWDARRNYEWKLSYGVWALLAAAVLHGFVALPITAGVVFLLAYASWLQSIWSRHVADGNFTWHFVNEAQRLLSKHHVEAAPRNSRLRIGGASATPATWQRRVGFLGDWGLRFQFLVSLFLTVVLYAAADEVTWFRMALKPG